MQGATNNHIQSARFWTLVAGIVLVLSLRADAAADPALAANINIAGSQRMLSQQIVLAYSKIGLSIMPDASRRQLNSAIARFDRQLADLKEYAPTPEIAEALKVVNRIWTPFMAAAKADVTRDGVRRLWVLDEDLLYASHKVVRLLQDLSDQQYARLVNIAGRQRMLSQRMAKLYMLREWGFRSHTLTEDMEAARNEFEGALRSLQNAPENTMAIGHELENVALQWTWFDSALNLVGDDAYRLVVADSSQQILEGMDRVTALYEGIAPGQ